MINPRDLQAGQDIGRAIRVAREASGLSQQSFSRLVGCSRSTLHHIEHFNGHLDIGVLKVAAAAREAGLQFGFYRESPDLLQRKLERERAGSKASNVREKHLRIAAGLAVGDNGAFKRLEDARRIVDLWRKNGACSPRYIEGWAEILNGEPVAVAKKMLSLDQDWVNAMFQNTPFALEDSEAAVR